MIKNKNSISINVLSVLVILMSLLLIVVNPVNAWFTDAKQNGIAIEVELGNLNLKLYQNSIADANEILTNADNGKATTKKYIALNQEIVPDVEVPLNLILANKDQGSASMYVRYKFALYQRGVSQDKEITTEIIGFTAKTDEAGGFVKNDDGFYYYQDKTGANTLFIKNASATLLTHFVVPYSQFMDANGNILIKNSETIYIKLIVQASVYQNFA